MNLSFVHCSLNPVVANDPLAGIRACGPSVVAIGKFDGLHRGHRALLTCVLQQARQRGCQAGAVTFDAHPAQVLHGSGPARLTTLSERRELMADIGLDFLVVLKTTPALFATEADEFASTLIESLDLRAVVVGADFRFGCGARGDVHAMRRVATPYGVEVIGVELEKRGGREVSSTRIRQLLAAGRPDMAADLLGRPVSMVGTVTASRTDSVLVEPEAEAVALAAGSYRAHVTLSGEAAAQCAVMVQVKVAADGARQLLLTGFGGVSPSALPGRVCTVQFMSVLGGPRERAISETRNRRPPAITLNIRTAPRLDAASAGTASYEAALIHNTLPDLTGVWSET